MTTHSGTHAVPAIVPCSMVLSSALKKTKTAQLSSMHSSTDAECQSHHSRISPQVFTSATSLCPLVASSLPSSPISLSSAFHFFSAPCPCQSSWWWSRSTFAIQRWLMHPVISSTTLNDSIWRVNFDRWQKPFGQKWIPTSAVDFGIQGQMWRIFGYQGWASFCSKRLRTNEEVDLTMETRTTSH